MCLFVDFVSLYFRIYQDLVMSENSHDKLQEKHQDNHIHVQNLPANHMIQNNQSESRYHVLFYNQGSGVPETVDTRGGRAYTIVQLGQNFSVQLENQSNSNTFILNNNNEDTSNADLHLYNQPDKSVNSGDHIQYNKSNMNGDHMTDTTPLNIQNQSVKNRVLNSEYQSSGETSVHVNGNQFSGNNALFLKQSAVTMYPSKQSFRTNSVNSRKHLSVDSSQNYVDQSMNNFKNQNNQSVSSTVQVHRNQSSSMQLADSVYVNPTNCYTGSKDSNSSSHYDKNLLVSTTAQHHDNQIRNTTRHRGNQTFVTTTTTTQYLAKVSDPLSIYNTTLYGDSQTLYSTAQYIINQIPSSSSTQYLENQPVKDENIQKIAEHSPPIEQSGKVYIISFSYL